MTIKESILNYIKGNKYFSLNQLVKDRNLDKRIAKNYLLSFKKQGIVFEGGFGVYSTLKEEFQLVSHSRTQTIRNMLKHNFPFADFLIWDSRQLQPIYHHTQPHHLTFVETEKDLLSPFYERISKNYRDVFIEKHSQVYFKEFSFTHNPIVIRRMIKRSPYKGVMPVLEKILVDMFVDLNLYKYISENDYWQLWRNLCERYRINIGTVISYSKRRKCLKSLFLQLIENKIVSNVTFGAYYEEVAKVIKKQYYGKWCF